MAKLAGVPKNVLDIARAQLRGFEQNALRGEAAFSGQSASLSLAMTRSCLPSGRGRERPARGRQSALNELKSIDVDELSPRQALDVWIAKRADEDFPRLDSTKPFVKLPRFYPPPLAMRNSNDIHRW